MLSRTNYTKKPIRVVQFIDSLRSGGKERQLVELLKGLSRDGDVECELIVMSETTHYADLYKLDIPVRRLVRKSRRDPAIFWKMYRLLEKIQPHILQSWSSMCSVYALPAVKILDIKFVNGFLRNAPPCLGIKNKEWRRSKLTFPFSDAIVANSKAGLKAYNAPKKKSCCIYNGFDFSRITGLEERELILKRYRITTPLVVGMVATFSDNKDFLTFINAAQHILETRRDVTFLAVGDGPNRRQCMELVKKENRQFVLFPGKIKDVESLAHVFNVGVLVSNKDIHGEGISNTIMEYMALGKPVIATDCGGNRELVVEGKTGYLLHNGDHKALTERLNNFLNRPNIAKEFGRAGAERLCEIFTLERMTYDYLELYHQLLES
ncbi:glycosyltransferase [Thermodesulfobacteriota bacterium B35]